MADARRIPLFRIGLTVVVGAVLVSLFQFYLGLGQSLSSMSGETPSTSPRDLLSHFTGHFLFTGAIASVLFWIGIGAMVAGIARNVLGGRTE